MAARRVARGANSTRSETKQGNYAPGFFDRRSDTTDEKKPSTVVEGLADRFTTGGRKRHGQCREQPRAATGSVKPSPVPPPNDP